MKWTFRALAWLVPLLICEAGIRVYGRYSIDGEFWAGSILLRPYRLPVQSAADNLKRYLASDNSRLMYDEVVGWTPRPNYRAPDGLYSYNSQGIRGQAEFEAQPPAGTLRIAIFGDSHTHGDEVRDGETWGAQLSEELASRSVPNEVLNFGVSGYAMDQAYLRWEHVARKFSPQLVIFGFQPENTKRNLSLLRFFYTHDPAEISLTKPRFTLKNGSLKPVNIPTVPVNQILDRIITFPAWELSRYEYFYSPFDFENRLLFRSKLISFAYSAIHDSNKYAYARQEEFFYDPDQEPGLLALAIFKAFKQSVEESGAKFVVTHLPRIRHMAIMRRENTLLYQKLLDSLDQDLTVIHTERILGSTSGPADLQSLYIGAHHYTPAGNKFMGRLAADFLAEKLGSPLEKQSN